MSATALVERGLPGGSDIGCLALGTAWIHVPLPNQTAFAASHGNRAVNIVALEVFFFLTVRTGDDRHLLRLATRGPSGPVSEANKERATRGPSGPVSEANKERATRGPSGPVSEANKERATRGPSGPVSEANKERAIAYL